MDFIWYKGRSGDLHRAITTGGEIQAKTVLISPKTSLDAALTWKTASRAQTGIS